MPNKTIYVADNDLPLFERAQELSGTNLSATLVEALKQYIANFAPAEEKEGFETVTIKVSEGGSYLTKQFSGRLVAQYRLAARNQPRVQLFELYKTVKGKFALYYRYVPKWVEGTTNRDWEKQASLGSVANDHHFEVYDELEQVKDNAPVELYNLAVRNLHGENVEVLDI